MQFKRNHKLRMNVVISANLTERNITKYYTEVINALESREPYRTSKNTRDEKIGFLQVFY